MSRRAKVYTKYLVKRSIDGKTAQKDEKGNPILTDVMKTNIVITPEQAAELNHGWDSTEKPVSFYYKEDEVEEGDELDSLTKDQLVAKCNELGLETTGNKPELKERIANHKA